MSLATDYARILTSWRAIELFSAQSVPAADPTHQEQPVFRVLASEPLPWQPNHSLQHRSLPLRKVWRHFVYGGLFRSDITRDLLEKQFGDNSNVFDRPDDAAFCLFAFEVDAFGRPVCNTFALSSLGWALGRTLNPGPNDPNWLTGFVKAEDEARDDFEHRYALRVEQETLSISQDESLRADKIQSTDTDLVVSMRDEEEECTDSLETKENPLDHDDLIAEISGCIERHGVASLISKPMARVRSLLVSPRQDDTKHEPVLINSWFIDDLDRVANDVEQNKPGAALANYLTAPENLNTSERVDVRRSTDHIFETLSPALFPLGRWPEPKGYPLVTSQQFAINSIVQNIGNRSGIAAVNGPPGTGKTTLLRDLIANVTVERAMRLAELSSPQDAFDQSSSWTAGKFRRTIWHWKKSFHGHEIVIASSNNGAVENVTLEIPGVEAIDPLAIGELDYFRELASHILGKEAWGLMAAKLGKRANNAEFRSLFWFDRDADKEGHPKLPGMMSTLDRYREEPEDWRAAIDKFLAAVNLSSRHRHERQQAYEQGIKIRSLTDELAVNSAKQKDLYTHLTQAETALAQAIKNETHARNELETSNTLRFDHRRFRPSLIEILFTLGRAFRDWKKKDEKLKSATDTNERQLAVASEEQLVRSQALSEQQCNYNAMCNHLSDLEKELSRMSANQNLLAQSLGIRIPDPNSQEWQDDLLRELSAPWADDKWNQVRSQVFVAALELHQSFLRANASRIRQSLFAMMDILDGKVPHNAPTETVANAWRALFFIVPVVSTTFASLARLFPQLGSQSLGWVLVDEAGQSLPQEAVGALWRAQRAVIVGDPLQLEPIVSISLKAQEALLRHYEVDKTWTPGTSSVQRFADRVAAYGTYVESGEETVWVGTPLRVHRRCDAPMFEICNSISYSGLMVNGKVKDGDVKSAGEAWPSSRWINVESSTADGHWIQAEGTATVELLNQLISLGAEPNRIFLVSPFREVANRLRRQTRKFKGIRAGTVHTTQGKEADIVVLVLGSNPATPGARQWAASKPNLLNVAVSRAKQRLYVIGDLAAWRRCNYFSTCASLLEAQARQENPGLAHQDLRQKPNIT